VLQEVALGLLTRSHPDREEAHTARSK